MHTLNEQERKAIIAMFDAMQRLNNLGALNYSEASTKEYNEQMEFCRKAFYFAQKHLVGFTD